MKKSILYSASILVAAIILWVVALLMDYPVIPYIKTDYHIKGDTSSLSEKKSLEILDNTFIGLEVPDIFDEKEKCFDIWFQSKDQNQELTLHKFSLQLRDDSNEEQKQLGSFMFWAGGSQNTLNTEKRIIDQNENYVFLRSMYNTTNIKAMNVIVAIDLTIDGIHQIVKKDLMLEKKTGLAWTRLRFH